MYIELFFAVVDYCGRCVLEKRFIGNTFLFEYGLSEIRVAPGGTLWPKNQSTKLLHIVLCYTQGVVAYDPVLFGGCIPPPLTPLQVKPEALILISIGGRTLQCGVMYIFLCSCVTKIDFYHLLWNWQVKRLMKQHKTEIKMCLFVFGNQFEHVTSNTKFRLAQIRVATFLHIMLQVCHRGKSSHKSSVTLRNDGI